MNPRRVVMLPGDGVGPEVTAAARQVLEAAGRTFGLQIEVEEHPVGWAAVRLTDEPLPAETLRACRGADAVFLGAVGHPDARDVDPARRPEAGLLALRSALGCHTNLRPVRIPDTLVHASPLRPERVRGLDLVIVRELAGGLYYGRPRGREGEGTARKAWNTLEYTAPEIERVARTAFTLAAERRGKVTSVDKANVLETSRLWREVVSEVAAEHPDVTCEHMLVDRAAMEVVLRPGALDVVLTSNLFGDVLSDAAAGVAGSLGLLPSASLGRGVPLFEPVHGSAPDLEGRGVANPIGAILSVAMLLDRGLAEKEAAGAVHTAVDRALEEGFRTADLTESGEASVGTDAFALAVAERLGAPDRGAAQPTGKSR